jgi:DNA-binding transcriptional ArsR family regulator
LHPIEVELRLTELEKQHYIHCARMLNDNPYSLLDKGKEYVVKNNLLNKELKSKEAEAKIKLPAAPLVADKPADNQTKLGNFIESLQALREHLPEGDIEEKFVDIYHKTTIAIQMGTALNLSQFFIPQKELERRIESFPTGPNIPRHPRAEVEYSKERYCDRAIFLLALDLAINHLKQELRPKEPVAEPEPPTPPPVDLDKSVNAIPFPSPFSPDETQKQILILLAHPYCSPLAHDLAQDLNLSVVRTQNHLDKLKEHGYVTANQFNEQFEPMYRLTRKAREFLVENNLVD